MTSKFKVGDKVIFNEVNKEIAKEFGYKPNEAYEIKNVFLLNGTIQLINENGMANAFDENRFLLAEPKQTKNQRITALENEVSELKLIVAQIRKPSTVVEEALTTATSSVEDIIEFEGNQYKKVDREAREGDVVIVKKSDSNNFAYIESAYIETQKPYMVLRNGMITDEDSSGCKGTFSVYAPEYGRTPETVDVYELIVEETQFPPFVIPEPAPVKSPNEKRAEMIEKAKSFLDENGGDDYHFDIDEKKSTVFAYKVITPRVGRYFVKQGFSKCHPNDVFNADIGKAISFGRAEKLDVSEFEQAVQPNEVVIGHVATHEGSELDYTITEIDGDMYYTEPGSHYHKGSFVDGSARIINDTNAIYGGGE